LFTIGICSSGAVFSIKEEQGAISRMDEGCMFGKCKTVDGLLSMSH